MTEEIPKELLRRIKTEREEEYYEGFEAGVEFAKESDYATIDVVVNAIETEAIEKLVEVLGDVHDYFDKSSAWQEGFHDALKEILEKK